MRIVLLAITGVILGVFAILFMIANNSWVIVRIPSAPWSLEPAATAFESRSSAIMLTSFLTGCLTISILWRRTRMEQKKREHANLLHIEQLQKQLQKADRLLASSREKERT